MKLTKVLTITTLLLFPLRLFAQTPDQNCDISNRYYQIILEQVELKNPGAIKDLPDCFKLDRKLILKASIIDPSHFQYAAEILKEDESFVRRLLKVSPEVLQYASPKLRMNQNFMERATYLNRNALQYADPKPLNNKIFMRKMIDLDSKNYSFASDRLKELPEFAAVAFADNGLLLEKAPAKIKADKNLVKIAIKSNSSAFEFASDELKKDKELRKLAARQSSIKSAEELENFLRENYLTLEKKKNLGLAISSQGKFFKDNQIIQRNYVTKWQRSLAFHDGQVDEDTKLIAADSRNYPILWKEDLKKYPDLVKKIENFFLNHRLDKNTINNLSVTYLWKVKAKPLTLVFNLYLLRDSKDIDLGSDFADVTSLTVIAQKSSGKWRMSVVEVIFDSEIKVDITYPNGHKKYFFWDLYKTNEKDKNPKIIFKVEDRFKEYFEIFEEQSGGKYQMIYRIDPFAKKDK